MVGRSGCGKSTLLRCIGGLIAPTTGSIKISGQIVTEPNPQIGYVFQQPVLLPWRTVEANVSLPFEVKGKPTKEEKNKVKKVLEIVGLSDYAKHRPGELSGGMQQRVGLARALATSPNLLMLDETFNTMDKKTQVYLNGKINAIANGRTLIATIHDMLFIDDFDWIIVLDKGSVVGQGEHDELMKNCELYNEMWELEGQISAGSDTEVKA